MIVIVKLDTINKVNKDLVKGGSTWTTELKKIH